MKNLLNKIHYGIFQMLLNLHEREDNFFLKVFPKKYKAIFKKNKMKSRRLYYDKENGVAIMFTHHLLGYFYSAYWSLFSFPLMGVIDTYRLTENTLLKMIVFAFPIAIGYIPMCKAVFSNDRYLMYYKQFEKKDAQWHRKWKWIAVAFCIGSILAAVLGFIIMVLFYKRI